MRVLLSIGSLRTGGAERQVAALADGMLRRGVEARVVTMSPGGSNWRWLESRWYGSAVALFQNAPRGRLEQAWRHLIAPVRLRGLIGRFTPDVVYSVLGISNAIAWAATRAGGPPAVWGIRASRVADSPEERLAFHFCRCVSRTVPLAIANAQAAHDFHITRGYRPRAFAIVPNGFDTDLYRPDPQARASIRSEWGVAPSQLVVGSVGRLNPVKGYETLLGAARHLIRISRDLVFVIVGDGDRAYRERLHMLSRRMGIEQQVLWLGQREDMPRVYNGFDLLCSAALSEGFPNVVGEAMACGVGCIVTDAGDCREIVGDTGIVVPIGDVAALADGVRRGLAGLERKDPDRVRARIERLFCVDRMVGRTVELLERAASGRPSPAHSVVR